MPTTQKMSRSTRTKTLSQPAEDKGYLAFLQGLELVSLALKSCSANINSDDFFRAWQKEKHLTRKYHAQYALTEQAKKYFDCEGQIDVAVADSKDQQLLTVQCVYLVHMHAKDDFSKVHAERFVQSELKLIVVPYARQLVTDLTARMSVPPIVIPLTTTG